MRIEAPTELQDWIDAHHHELHRAIPLLKAVDGEDDASRVDVLKKFASAKDFREQYEHDLETALQTLDAPHHIQHELTSYRDALHEEWHTLSDSDRDATLKMVHDLAQTATTKEVVISYVAERVESADLSAKAAANVIRGLTPLVEASIPWWCIVCYTIPIWGLICIAVARCRGKGITVDVGPARDA